MENIPDIEITPETKINYPQTVTQIPEYNEDIFKKATLRFTDSTKDGVIDDVGAEFLNEIATWWQKQPEIIEGINRSQAAISDPNLPELEHKEAGSLLQSSREIAEKINTNINTLIEAQDLKGIANIRGFRIFSSGYEKIKDTAFSIVEFQVITEKNPQIVALCEAISAVKKDKNLSDKEIRTRIAQHAFYEIVTLIPYAKSSEETISTNDPLPIEREELEHSLRKEEWTKEQYEKHAKTYKELKSQMESRNFSNFVNESFEQLYQYTIGEIPEDISSIRILSLQEEIFQELYQNNAFSLES